MSELKMQHKFVVKELSLFNKEKEGNSFQVKPLFSKKITKLNEKEYEVVLKVEFKDTPQYQFPFDLTAAIALITKIEGAISEVELDNYLNKTCIEILFPYLRSIVTSITSAALMTPLVLPIIDVNNFKTNNFD